MSEQPTFRRLTSESDPTWVCYQCAHYTSTGDAASEDICMECAAYALDELTRVKAELATAQETFEATLERDRTTVCDGVNALLKILRERDWLGESRGSYEWDDDRWHQEFRDTADEIHEAVAGMQMLMADLNGSPKTSEGVIRARTETKERIAKLEAERDAAIARAEDYQHRLNDEQSWAQAQTRRVNELATKLQAAEKRADDAVAALDNTKVQSLAREKQLVGDIENLRIDKYELSETIRILLKSADCEWEEKHMGHDWAEACQQARTALCEPKLRAIRATKESREATRD